MPLFSIIIPVYNVENYLHRCIESILSQPFTDYEVIMVDDGSPDCSGALCDEAAAKDNRIKVIHKENGGVSTARNAGLDRAQGDYLLFVDADDELAPSTLQSFATTIGKWANADVIQGQPVTIGGDKGFIVPRSINEYNNDHDALTCFLLHTVPWGIWSKAFRRSVIEQNHIRFIPGIIMGEDQLFMYHFQFHANSYAICPSDVYLYHLDNETSVMHSVDKTRSYCSEIRVAEEAVLALPHMPNELLYRFVYRFLSYENYSKYMAGRIDKARVSEQIATSYRNIQKGNSPMWAKVMFLYLTLPDAITSNRLFQSMYYRLINILK